MLLLDTGDVLNGVGEYANIKAQFYAKAFPYLHYDAVGIGEMEAQYMREFSNQYPFSKDVAVVNANITDTSTNKPLTHDAYVIRRTKNGLNVGIISIISELLLDQGMQKRISVQPSPEKEALQRELAGLRAKCDIVILLYHGDYQAAKSLASEFPDIDIVLDGHPGVVNHLGESEQVGKTTLMAVKPSGKYVGRLVLDISADRKIANIASDYAPMDTSYQDDPEMAKLLTQDDKSIEDYYARVRMQYARYGSDPGQPRLPQPFVSTSKCRTCHAAEFDSWSKTGHAKSFDALKKTNSTHDPQCVTCHTTGYQLKGGFTSEEATPDLTQVQCETCHGPGVIHSRRPAKGYGLIMQSTCVQCHDRADSPHFDYDVYRTRILHKVGDGAAISPVSK